MPDDLLGELRAAGTKDSSGFFTLDARKAQQKMQEFGLVDPHHYILCLIQAAVAMKSTAIRVQVDLRTVRMHADDCQLDVEFLRQPLAGLFISQERRDLEGLRQLSIGLNAALSLRPSVIEVRAGTTLLQLRSAQDAECKTVEASHPGMSVTVQDRWSWRVASRAVAAALRKVPEAVAVRQKACWCAVPLILGGSGEEKKVGGDWRQAAGEDCLARVPFEVRIPRPHTATEENPDAAAWRKLSGGQAPLRVWGWLWVGAELLHFSTITLVKHGVEIRQRQMDMPPLQVHGVAYVDDLLTNASGSDVIADEAFEKVVAAMETATLDLFYEICRSVEMPRTRDFLLDLARLLKQKGRARAHTMLESLRRLPLLRRGDGHMVDAESVAEQAGPLDYVLWHVGPLPGGLQSDQIVLDLNAEDRELAELLIGKRLVAVTDVDKQLKRYQNLKHWSEGQEGSPRVFAGVAYLEVLSFGSGPSKSDSVDCSGELGLPRLDLSLPLSAEQVQAHVAFFVKNRELVSKPLNVRGLVFRAAVNCDSFHPNPLWDDIQPDQPYLAVLKVLTNAYRIACENLAKRCPPRHSDAPLVRFYLLRLLAACPSMGIKPAELPPVIQHYPMYHTIADSYTSLAVLERDCADFGQAHYTVGMPVGTQADYRQIVRADAALPMKVLVDEVVTGLQWYLGKVSDYSDRLHHERILHVEGALPTVTGLTICSVQAEAVNPPAQVAVGLALPPAEHRARAADTPGGELQSTIRWFHGTDAPHERRCMLEAGPLYAVVRLRTPELQGTEKDFFHALEAVRNTVPGLAIEVAARYQGLNGWRASSARKFLLEYVAWKGRELPPVVANLPLFHKADGETSSTLEVLAEFDANHGLHILGPELAERLSRVNRVLRASDRPVFVCAEDTVQDTLAALVGRANLYDWTSELKEGEAKQSFLQRPQEEPLLAANRNYLMLVPLAKELQGQVGLLAWSRSFNGRSEVRVLHQNRHLCTIQVSTRLPLTAIVAGDSIAPNPQWDGLASLDINIRIANAVNAAADAALQMLARHPTPSLESWHLMLWYALNGIEDASHLLRFKAGDVRALIAASQRFRDTAGDTLSLHDLAEEYQRTRQLRWVGQGVRGRPKEGRVLRLSMEELGLLRTAFSETVEYSKKLVVEQLTRPATPAPHLPDGDYIARVTVLGEVQGELAVAAGDQPFGITLMRGKTQYQTEPLFEDLPVAGVLESDRFAVGRNGDAVVTAGLQKSLDRYLDQLYGVVASRAVKDAAACEQLFKYYLHRQTEIKRGFRDSLPSELFPRLFTLARGERVTLRQLLEHIRDEEFIPAYSAPPQHAPPDFALLVAAGSAELHFLRQFFSMRIRWEGQGAPTVVVEEKAVPVPPPPPLPPQPTAPPAPLPPHERLQLALRECFAALPGHMDQPQFYHFPEMAHLDDKVIYCDGRRVLVNRSHAAVEKLMQSSDPAAIAVLASAVFTAANQAREDITDAHEMHFLSDLADWLDSRL